MESAATLSDIFNRNRRKALRERAVRRGGDRFLWEYVAAELSERLDLVSRSFARALFIGPLGQYADQILGSRQCAVTRVGISIADGQICQEDHLPFDSHSFDLVIAAGTLDSVNDLPGALIQIRHILEPDGLFLGHIFGAGSLATLKSLLMMAEMSAAGAHIHPQIDLKSAADLLSRAGFALPVADGDMMPVRYGNWRSIVSDIRDAGIGNALAGPRRYLGNAIFERIDAVWASRVDDLGKVEERFHHLFLSGWAPSPDQRKPLVRGSGAISLAAVLPPTGQS
jgi:SAM-dependent methyltransferase